MTSGTTKSRKKKLPSSIRDELIRKSVWDNLSQNYDYVNIMGVYTLVKLDKKKDSKKKKEEIKYV